MATAVQLAALKVVYEQARLSGHIFPQAAAAEGALESSWFTSQLYVKANNVFGQKASHPPAFPTIALLTKEFIHNTFVTVNSTWNHYPTLADCFRDRMQTLVRLAPHAGFEHYKNALAATTPEQFLTEVSLKWSTDPERGNKAIAIMHAHQEILNG